MLRKALRKLAHGRAKRHLLKSCAAQISPTAKVSYLGLRGRPPAKLSIGEFTIFEGRILADRPTAVVSIGNNTFIGNSTLVCAEKIEIGDDVLISWGCTIVDHHSHAVAWKDRAKDVRDYYDGKKNWEKVKIAPVKIGNKAWIGFNSIILCGVTIGEGAVVACGSIVTRDVAPYSVVAGNPAREIRKVEDAG